MFDAKVLTDSIASGVRLTTLQVTFPRIVLAEFNTHRVFSRSSASSRAIPVEKRIAEVRQNAFIPEAFGANKKGMQAGDALGDESQEAARMAWLDAAYQATQQAAKLAQIGVHKQWANRMLEPFLWHTVIVTATEWANFFALRCSPEAQPEIRTAAELMRAALAASTPVERKPGEWHLPFVFDEDYEAFSDLDPAALPFVDLPKVSTARCARVTHLTHDGKRDLNADCSLHDRLLMNGHMSPFEHAAKVVAPSLEDPLFAPVYKDDPANPTQRVISHFMCGNFKAPWVQYRKTIPGEDLFQSFAT
jgi:hypothetical protein